MVGDSHATAATFAHDWNKDGHLDLIVGDEDGRVAFVEHSGKSAADGTPIFMTPRYFKQEADTLKFGALSTPWGYDWDGDGDDDILAGNTAGYIGFFENLSGPGSDNPRWAAPELLAAGEEIIRIQAGSNGSIQGPAEAKWGYTTLSVADWDGDALPDLIVNSIWGHIVWYKNIGSRTQPRLAKQQSIDVEWRGSQPRLQYGWLRPQGKALLTQWRTTPVAIDWNRDGMTDLAVLDQDGYLSLNQRERRNGKLVLSQPKRIFCDKQGHPLQLNAGKAGRSGRRKLCFADWDNDGSIDLIVNSFNATFMKQVNRDGVRGFFEDKGLMHSRKISGHTTSPGIIDLNADSVPELLIGAEDGRFYYMRNPTKPKQ